MTAGSVGATSTMFAMLTRGAVAGFWRMTRRPLFARRRQPVEAGPSWTAACATIHRQAFRSLLLGALAFRVLVLLALPIPIAARGGAETLVWLLPGGALLLVANVGALATAYRYPAIDFGRIRGMVLVDLLLAYAVSLLISATTSYPELFVAYLAGAVALTTGAYGLLGGFAAALLSVPVQLAGPALGASVGGATVTGRFLWLGLAAVVAVAALVVCGLSVHRAMLYGLRAGRDAERARMLRALHDTVLQTLEAIALQSAADETEPRVALAELRGAARVQAGRLRRMLAEGGATDDTTFFGALAELSEEFAVQGLRVELAVATGAGNGLPRAGRAALLAAVREALGNVAKHARVNDAVVRVVEDHGGLVVVVRDHGRGFDVTNYRRGYGLRESITARLRDVDGEGTVESWPGRGTRVTLRMPA
ncbi:sensor histidine kinase [Micromonospora sp. NPDC003197]